MQSKKLDPFGLVPCYVYTCIDREVNLDQFPWESKLIQKPIKRDWMFLLKTKATHQPVYRNSTMVYRKLNCAANKSADVHVYPLTIQLVEMPWGGTWKSSIAAFLFLFLLLGVILTRNPLDASLASLSYFFTAILKITYWDTNRFTFETSEK